MASPSAAGGREQLRELVLSRGYVRADQPFRLSSGATSRDYVDMRRALARGDDLRFAGELVLDAVRQRGVEFDAAGGMTMGADPLAHSVAIVSGREWFSVRKAPKAHGAGRRVEGATLVAGTRVLLIEDTVSTGGSGLEAMAVVEELGARPVLACTLLDRAGVAQALFAERGVPFLALLDWNDLGIDRLDLPAGGP